MKKGRISKKEEAFIKDNIEVGHVQLAQDLNRDKNSVLEFIKKKIAKGDLPEPSWINQHSDDQAKYDLSYRPYYQELKTQFTDTELKLFEYHWTRIISQFQDDVIPTEELQVVDLIKLELLMNRSLRGNKENIEQITALEALVAVERARDADQQDREELFNMERQIASLKASQESLNRDYRDLQDKKNRMLKDMKATREQRVKRFEDSKSSFGGFMTHLIANPEVTRAYGIEMEQMRLAMEKEKERLSAYHTYEDGIVDQPFLTPDTVKED